MPDRHDGAFQSIFFNHDTTRPRATAGSRRIKFYTLGHIIASTSDAEDTDSSSDESQISVTWDATEANESLPQHGTDKHTQTVSRHVDNLVWCCVSTDNNSAIYNLPSVFLFINNLNILSRTRVCNPFVIQLFLCVTRNARPFC